MLRLNRKAAGFYESTDGRVQILAWARPEADGYGPAGQRQWVAVIDGQCDDRFDTKRAAIAAAEAILQEAESGER